MRYAPAPRILTFVFNALIILHQVHLSFSREGGIFHETRIRIDHFGSRALSRCRLRRSGANLNTRPATAADDRADDRAHRSSNRRSDRRAYPGSDDGPNRRAYGRSNYSSDDRADHRANGGPHHRRVRAIGDYQAARHT